MGWWRNFTKQANELVQQFLYGLELAIAGADDAPWIDTLNFLWDSLPDADKLTTADRRRLAHRMKQIVREQVHKHYTQELAQKEAIHKRQATREALAQQHLEQLADARQHQMRALAETARQQSMIGPDDMPGVVQGNSLWTPFDGQTSSPSPWPLLPQHTAPWQQNQRRQQRQQAMPGRVLQASTPRRGQQQKQLPMVQRKSSSGGSSSRLQPASSSHVVVQIPVAGSSSSSELAPVFVGFAARCLGVCTEAKVADADLQAPLLHSPKSPFAAEQQQQQAVAYEPPDQVAVPVIDLQQLDMYPAQGCKDSEAPIWSTAIQQQQQQHIVAPVGSQEIAHCGSQLLLERYFSCSSPPRVATTADCVGTIARSQCASLKLYSAEQVGEESVGLGRGGAGDLMQSVELAREDEGDFMQSDSQPPSECSAAASSVVAVQHSCCCYNAHDMVASAGCDDPADVPCKVADTVSAAAAAAGTPAMMAAVAADGRHVLMH